MSFQEQAETYRIKQISKVKCSVLMKYHLDILPHYSENKEEMNQYIINLLNLCNSSSEINYVIPNFIYNINIAYNKNVNEEFLERYNKFMSKNRNNEIKHQKLLALYKLMK